MLAMSPTCDSNNNLIICRNKFFLRVQLVTSQTDRKVSVFAQCQIRRENQHGFICKFLKKSSAGEP